LPDFVHLHNHSDFSLLRASSTVELLIRKAKAFDMPGVALTDDGNLFGALRFYRECLSGEKKINPIIGCDFFMATESRHHKSNLENANKYNRIVLLAQSDQGYRNLISLSSLGFTEGFYYKPRIDKELLTQYSKDIIALSGGMGGEIPQLISRNRYNDAKEVAAFYKELYGPDHFYLEMTDHGIPEQKIINRGLIQLSKELAIPLVAANDTYYIDKEDANAQDVLLCIGNKRKKHEVNRFKFSSQDFYIKTPQEMWALFGEIPEALTNTVRINEMCSIELELPGPLLPDFDIPPSFTSPDEYLRHLSRTGLRERYSDLTPELEQRLTYELDIIISMGFTGYFLIVWDFIRYARENGIPVGPGRGSGAGSIVAYVLKITDIDPIKYNLLFERFLNPDRVSMPDFDIDFCFERRQEVIDYVTRKYGNEKVGQIITFGTLKAKAVLRDVARVLDIPFSEADRIAKLIPDDLKITIPKALEQEPKLKELQDQGGVLAELINTSMKLEKLSRHASTHAAGVVIGKEELTKYVALFRDPKTGAISTQFTMDLLEDVGLVKMDFLGLKTLTLIENTVKLIRTGQIAQARSQGQNPKSIELFDIETIPEDDKPTFALLGEGKSMAVFQFESSGMQATLKRAKPSCIEDLIALNALYRPGPMDNIPQFIDSKWGRTPIRYPHPDLEPVLKETYGVIVYQEQVMEIVKIIGGFSLGEADILRRAMGKKKEKEMAKMHVRYMEGAKARGISEKVADEIFELLKPFAGYGFNKSHAAAYSVLAYKTAYLKANYPAEFMAANLTNEINSPDKFAQYMAETKAMGIPILAPDINKSDKFFSVSDGSIFFGLMGMKGVGTSAVDEIIRVRQESGPFTSFQDFIDRVDTRIVNKKVLEIMIKCGVFDSLIPGNGPKRLPLFSSLGAFIDQATAKKDSRAFGQTGLFDDTMEDFPQINPDFTQEFDLLEILSLEKETMGHYFSGHPMDRFRKEWERGTNLNPAKVLQATHDKEYAIVALLKEFRSVFTKKGTRMAFGTLEDYNGTLEFVLFPDTYAQYAETIAPDTVFGFVGTLDLKRDMPQLIVNQLRQPGEMDEQEGGDVHVRIVPGSNEEDMMDIRALLHKHPGPSQVYLHLELPSGKVVLIKISSTLRISSLQKTLDLLENHPFVQEVWKEYTQETNDSKDPRDSQTQEHQEPGRQNQEHRNTPQDAQRNQFRSSSRIGGLSSSGNYSGPPRYSGNPLEPRVPGFAVTSGGSGLDTMSPQPVRGSQLPALEPAMVGGYSSGGMKAEINYGSNQEINHGLSDDPDAELDDLDTDYDDEDGFDDDSLGDD
jgi:DNA polymerase-3 subunit alpha